MSQTPELRLGHRQVATALPRMVHDGPRDLRAVDEDLDTREARGVGVVRGAVVPGHGLLDRLRDAKVDLGTPHACLGLRDRDRKGRVPVVVEPISVVDMCLRQLGRGDRDGHELALWHGARPPVRPLTTSAGSLTRTRVVGAAGLGFERAIDADVRIVARPPRAPGAAAGAGPDPVAIVVEATLGVLGLVDRALRVVVAHAAVERDPLPVDALFFGVEADVSRTTLDRTNVSIHADVGIVARPPRAPAPVATTDPRLGATVVETAGRGLHLARGTLGGRLRQAEALRVAVLVCVTVVVARAGLEREDRVLAVITVLTRFALRTLRSRGSGLDAEALGGALLGAYTVGCRGAHFEREDRVLAVITVLTRFALRTLRSRGSGLTLVTLGAGLTLVTLVTLVTLGAVESDDAIAVVGTAREGADEGRGHEEHERAHDERVEPETDELLHDSSPPRLSRDLSVVDDFLVWYTRSFHA